MRRVVPHRECFRCSVTGFSVRLMLDIAWRNNRLVMSGVYILCSVYILFMFEECLQWELTVVKWAPILYYLR